MNPHQREPAISCRGYDHFLNMPDIWNTTNKMPAKAIVAEEIGITWEMILIPTSALGISVLGIISQLTKLSIKRYADFRS